MSSSTWSDFDKLKRLGAGSFGTVFKVKRHADQLEYVIKEVLMGQASNKEQKAAINEVQLLADLDSAFIVRYKDSFIDKDIGSLNIVMEYCDKGDLSQFINKAKSKSLICLKQDITWNIVIQVMMGLYYLHSRNIIHRDLKSANVFLSRSTSRGATFFDVKIGDLGVSKLMDSSAAMAQTFIGTPYYLSPELCSDEPYRDKSDCWALGVLMYECCTMERPFEAGNACALMLKIIKAEFKPFQSLIKKNCSELTSLITALLKKDPNDRPRIKDILAESYMREVAAINHIDLPNEILATPATFALFQPNQRPRRGSGAEPVQATRVCESDNSGSGNDTEMAAAATVAAAVVAATALGGGGEGGGDRLLNRELDDKASSPAPDKTRESRDPRRPPVHPKSSHQNQNQIQNQVISSNSNSNSPDVENNSKLRHPREGQHPRTSTTSSVGRSKGGGSIVGGSIVSSNNNSSDVQFTSSSSSNYNQSPPTGVVGTGSRNNPGGGGIRGNRTRGRGNAGNYQRQVSEKARTRYQIQTAPNKTGAIEPPHDADNVDDHNNDKDRDDLIDDDLNAINNQSPLSDSRRKIFYQQIGEDENDGIIRSHRADSKDLSSDDGEFSSFKDTKLDDLAETISKLRSTYKDDNSTSGPLANNYSSDIPLTPLSASKRYNDVDNRASAKESNGNIDLLAGQIDRRDNSVDCAAETITPKNSVTDSKFYDDNSSNNSNNNSNNNRSFKHWRDIANEYETDEFDTASNANYPASLNHREVADSSSQQKTFMTALESSGGSNDVTLNRQSNNNHIVGGHINRSSSNINGSSAYDEKGRPADISNSDGDSYDDDFEYDEDDQYIDHDVSPVNQQLTTEKHADFENNNNTIADDPDSASILDAKAEELIYFEAEIIGLKSHIKNIRNKEMEYLGEMKFTFVYDTCRSLLLSDANENAVSSDREMDALATDLFDLAHPSDITTEQKQIFKSTLAQIKILIASEQQVKDWEKLIANSPRNKRNA